MELWIRLYRQTLAVLDAMPAPPGQWHHGYSLSQSTRIPSGTLYPILMRVEKLHWLATRARIGLTQAVGVISMLLRYPS
jgi:hypothetical protein